MKAETNIMQTKTSAKAETKPEEGQMNSLQRCELAAIFFSALMLFAIRAWPLPETNAYGAKQSVELNTAANPVNPDADEIQLSQDRDFVNAAGLAGLRVGDKVQVQSEKTAAGQFQAQSVKKV